MAFDFFPPAIGVGNVAEWATVVIGVWAAAIAAVAAVVGIAGTAATVWVALLAHRTSQRATQIAEKAAQIAQQQHDEAVANREANARIIGGLLMHEVSELPQNIFTQILRCKRRDSRQRPNINSFKRALEVAGSSFLPGAEQLQDRIHNLRDDLGDDLATLIGYSRTLNQMSRDFLAQVKTRVPGSVVESDVAIYAGNERDIGLFTDYLVLYLDMAIPFANRFRQFGGIDAYDYSNLHVADV